MTVVAPAGGPRSVGGRTRITARALDRVITAVAAEHLHVDPHDVSVRLGDGDGDLAVTVTTPLRVVSLDRVMTDPGAVARSGGAILERIPRAQEHIRDRASELTGSRISRVALRVSGVAIRPERRVQ